MSFFCCCSFSLNKIHPNPNVILLEKATSSRIVHLSLAREGKLTTLPQAIKELVVSYLHFRDIAALAVTASTMQIVADAPRHWKEIAAREIKEVELKRAEILPFRDLHPKLLMRAVVAARFLDLCELLPQGKEILKSRKITQMTLFDKAGYMGEWRDKKHKELTSLRVYGSCLPVLSTEIGALQTLSSLTFFHCSIGLIPSTIVKLQKLMFFQADNAQLERVPQELWLLPALRKVELQNNRLSELNIPNKPLATELVEIDISNNAITTLSGLSSFSNLKVLKASGNYLSDPFEELIHLTRLERLDLSHQGDYIIIKN